MSVVFTEPNIACVGTIPDDPEGVVIGRQRFGPNGRARAMGRNRGLVRLYADRATGRLLGAAMVGPRVEHLAHPVAWSVQQELTVPRMLDMPFYHPVIEEALQEALEATRKALARARAIAPARELLAG